ncbi:glutathione-dependent formaldehyde dehydrogenase [Tersicoccus solisilvae]|uniref:Glutathione-dependent formaldehyde dehydrogenase n=1 Tax=Tersicoccus solisilvae TaxID=1882339 RepID=A0ABQ1NIY0_9MICC|nr:alcohol dehydrogenase catalytic domain-containing protein [Tersicoccus solisilvae]GGC77989.1 glutathione-dependent formaldehyde dehydrogenase [Tersicoccus solisilvae]
MKAVVWHGEGDIRLDTVDDPTIQQPTDAIVQITRSAICGTDLHFIRGTMSGMAEGTILGHEAVGVVTEVGSAVRRFSPGDRVLICSTMSCGACRNCRRGLTAQCDVANPNGPLAGTCFFGGPQPTGPVDGLQAEYVRVPWAVNTLIPLPENVSDDAAILLSDIFPTAWFGAELAGVNRGDTVAVLGAGVVGQFAIASAFRQGAGRVIAVDGLRSRLDIALGQHAEVIDFNAEDPVPAILESTQGIGVDAVIDAVGVDAQRPWAGPAKRAGDEQAEQFDAERSQVAPQTNVQGENWVPGNAPSQALQWAVSAVAKGGRLGVIGVYPPAMTSFPIGEAMNKNLIVKLGNCNHHTVTPPLLDIVATGLVDPTALITQQEPLTSAVEAYESFDRREEGWLKTELTVG